MYNKIVIYYDSVTGNIERFTKKLAIYGDYEFKKISPTLKATQKGHLVTFTTGIGQISKSTKEFLEFEDNFKNILTVASSGNMNWGLSYGKAGNLIEQIYDIKLIMKFELSGTAKDIEKYDKILKYIERRQNYEMDTFE